MLRAEDVKHIPVPKKKRSILPFLKSEAESKSPQKEEHKRKPATTTAEADTDTELKKRSSYDEERLKIMRG